MKKSAIKLTVLLLTLMPVLFMNSCQEEPEMQVQDEAISNKSGELEGELVTYWGEETFTREDGKPVVTRMKIGSEDLQHFEDCFVLKIKNGNDDGTNRVSSAIVKVDGETIFNTKNFSLEISCLEKEICGLTEESEIEVELRSEEASFVDIWIEGFLKSGIVFAGIKSAELVSEDGLVKIFIPDNSLEENVFIKISECEVEPPPFNNGTPIGKTYSLKPDGQKFLKSLGVSMKYQDDLDNSQFIGVLHWDDKSIELISPINEIVKKEINFDIEHFSTLKTIKFNNEYAVWNVYWVIDEILWYLEEPNPPTLLNEENIQRALDLWQSETSSFVFKRTYDKNKANLIFKESYKLPYLEAIDCASGVFESTILGVACFDVLGSYFVKELDENNFVEIRIASDELVSLTEWLVIAHEVGHALGIAHTVVANPDAMMNSEFTIISKLHAWDVEALHVHYNPAINTDSYTDSRDGYTYKTVKIGDQWWFAENLAYLPQVYPLDQQSDTEARYYVYGYNGIHTSIAKNSSNFNEFGVLYNFPAALEACPDGWHLPSNEEWNELAKFINEQKGPYYHSESAWYGVGGHLKSKSGWYAGWDDGSGTDDYGFRALPGGYLFDTFKYLEGDGYWWSSTMYSETNAYLWWMSSYRTTLSNPQTYMRNGLSVRCVKDNL